MSCLLENRMPTLNPYGMPLYFGAGQFTFQLTKPDSKISRLISLLMGLTMIGTLLELLFIEHHESWSQSIPVVLIGLSGISFLILFFWQSVWIKRTFLILMAACFFSGFLGIYFHLLANYEFELEIHPNQSGWPLFKEMLSGALPALAPGSMIGIAIMGYIFYLLNNLKQQSNENQ